MHRILLKTLGLLAGVTLSIGSVSALERFRMQYPDLSTSVMEGRADPGLLQFNEVIPQGLRKRRETALPVRRRAPRGLA